MMNRIWQTARRQIAFGNRPLVMGILNVTPDSFSDGGKFSDIDHALSHAAQMIEEGADMIDVGGESTRPNSVRVSVDEEISRVVPVIKELSRRFDAVVSIDTSRAEVADAAIASGAEIVNDVSGLKFDPTIAEIAAKRGAGLVLMHLRGTFETMHSQPEIIDIIPEVFDSLENSIEAAKHEGVKAEQICIDPGIGFGKSVEQNFELIAKIAEIKKHFQNIPLLIGASRKSFIGKVLNQADPERRSSGSLAAHVLAAWNEADILRVHDVRETAEALKIVEAVKGQL
ncbi:MAG: dihydropteroate synthase [Pyrinomonadaceae bacterium]|nr:dihydropteroate synthase [Pyrinomonadaceae bacterium]